MTSPKIAVLDDTTADASVIGYAATEEEAAQVFMAYNKERMSAEDFADLEQPEFEYRITTSAASPAFEPLF